MIKSNRRRATGNGQRATGNFRIRPLPVARCPLPVASLLFVFACGSGKPAGPTTARIIVPQRAPTAGDALLENLPPGPDAIAELDLARMRKNPHLGEVLAAVPRSITHGFDPLRDVDVAVAAVYRLAADEAATLIILRGEGLQKATLIDATRLDDKTVALGPADLRAQARSENTREPGPEMMALRAAAMPSRADGAVLRIAARLDDAARIGAAGRLGVDEVPATLSVWLDVADDAALVAVLGGDDPANAKRLERLVEHGRERLAGLVPPEILQDLRVETTGTVAKVIWVVKPRRLAAWAAELKRKFGGDI